jgi:hypothetical protein
MGLIDRILFGSVLVFMLGLHGFALRELQETQRELIRVRSEAQKARIWVTEIARNLEVIREQWNLKHNDRIDFMVRIRKGGE